MKKIYILEMILMTGDYLTIEPIGVYTSMKRASMYLDKCEKTISEDMENHLFFDVISYPLNEMPTYLKFGRGKSMSNTESAIKELLDKGLIDQLIGEDGHFYYILTEEGKKVKDKIQSYLPRIDRKNNDN